MRSHRFIPVVLLLAAFLACAPFAIADDGVVDAVEPVEAIELLEVTEAVEPLDMLEAAEPTEEPGQPEPNVSVAAKGETGEGQVTGLELSSSSIRLGASVTMTPQTSGDVSGFEFNYAWALGSGWDFWGSTVLDTGSRTSATSWEFTPRRAGAYRLWIDAVAPDGTTQLFQCELTVGPAWELESIELSPDPGAPGIDTQVTLHFADGSNTLGLSYNFVWRKNPDWSVWDSDLKDGGSPRSESSAALTLPGAGVYTIWVDVIDAEGTSRTFTASEEYVVEASDGITGLDLSATSIAWGETVTLSPHAKGDASRFEFNYAWAFADGWDLWDSTVLRTGERSKDPTWDFKPPIPGEYRVWIDAVAPDGTTQFFERELQVTYDAQSDAVQIDVAAYDQTANGYPTGCESASLYMLLQYYGVDVSMWEIVSDLPREPGPSGGVGGNPERAFIGDPTKTSGYGVFEKPIADLANGYLDGASSLVGAVMEDIYWCLDQGEPLIAWISMRTDGYIRWGYPTWTDYKTGESVPWPYNEHAVVVSGYEPGAIRVTDPLWGSTHSWSLDGFQAGFSSMGGRIVWYQPEPVDLPYQVTGLEISATRIMLGQSVTMTPQVAGDASGAEFNYAWSWEGQWGDDWDSTVKRTGSTTSETSWSFTPSKPGNYRLWIDAQQANGRTRQYYRDLVVTQDWQVESVVVSPDAGAPGEPVTVEVVFAEGSNTAGLSYNFAWRLKPGWSTWDSDLKDGGSARSGSTAEFILPEMGAYEIWVDVIDASGKKSTYVAAESYQVEQGWSFEGIELLTTGDIERGGSIDFAVNVTGPRADDLEYNFAWKRGDSWNHWGSTVKDTGARTSESQASVTAAWSGAYHLWVDVHDQLTGVTETYFMDDAVSVLPGAGESFAASYAIAASCEQIVAIQGTGGAGGVLTFHELTDDGWQETLRFDCRVGPNGVSSDIYEGACNATPAGTYLLGFAFGNVANPGTSMEYRVANNNIYWVDDSDSAYYNRWVDASQVSRDWKSAEHISSVGSAYDHCIFIQYNYPDTVPGAGSAFFIHCDVGVNSGGCVLLAKSDLITLLRAIDDGAYAVITKAN
ncbi:MAG: C39 family peptidase [Coriobacteriales bacterium]|nr:C39 family peptidase [Coriobacteriales bacterium]